MVLCLMDIVTDIAMIRAKIAYHSGSAEQYDQLSPRGTNRRDKLYMCRLSSFFSSFFFSACLRYFHVALQSFLNSGYSWLMAIVADVVETDIQDV